MTDCLEFWLWVFGSHFELELLTSDFKIRISEVPTNLLYFLIDIHLFVK